MKRRTLVLGGIGTCFTMAVRPSISAYADDDAIYVEKMGARVNSVEYDSGPALQAAIDEGFATNRKVILPFGTLYTGQTIRIYSRTILKGQGKTQSYIKALNDSNIGVIETNEFRKLTGSAKKFVTDEGMTWGFLLSDFTVDGNRQHNFGGTSGKRFGGVGADVWDGFGIRLYGRRYVVRDVAVRYCAGIGFYSECGNPLSANPSDWYYDEDNSQQGYIRSLSIHQCSYDGFVFRGPGDINITDLTSELCFYPDESYFGKIKPSLMFPHEGIAGIIFADKAENHAVAGSELGFIHSHTHKNGYGIRFEGNVHLRIRSDNLTSEGNLGGIKVRGKVMGQLNKVNIRNQNIGDGHIPDFDIKSDNNYSLYISEYENRGSQGNKGSTKLCIGSSQIQIGSVTIQGGIPGHGIVFEENVDKILINQLSVSNLRGMASDGRLSSAVLTKSGVDDIYINLIYLFNNDIGWSNESVGRIFMLSGGIYIINDPRRNNVALPMNWTKRPNLQSIQRSNVIVKDKNLVLGNSFIGNHTIDPTSIVEQNIVLKHNMWRAPLIGEVSVSYVTDGSVRPRLDYLEVLPPNETEIRIRIKFQNAGNGTPQGSIVAVKV